MNRRIAVAAVLLALVGNAQAQSGTITFIGEVVEETCVLRSVVDGAVGDADFNVRIPDIMRRKLTEPGDRGVPTAFELVLGSDERPCRQPRVRGTFVNAGDTNAAGRLTNRGSAQNVEIVVLDAQGRDVNLVDPGQSQVVEVDAAGIGRLGWQATYHATAAVNSGNVAARLQYLVDYP